MVENLEQVENASLDARKVEIKKQQNIENQIICLYKIRDISLKTSQMVIGIKKTPQLGKMIKKTAVS